MMRTYFIVLVFLTVFCARGEAGKRKLNGARPVCFGARDNQFGSFHYRGPTLHVASIYLVHRSGTVTCHRQGGKRTRSFWGCAPNNHDNPGISVYLTDCRNRVIAPKPGFGEYTRKGTSSWYKLSGYQSSSRQLRFSLRNRVRISDTDQLRLWYGEDLYGWTEGDNGGRSCADVFAYF